MSLPAASLPQPTQSDAILRVVDLTVRYPRVGRVLAPGRGHVEAVAGVGLSVPRGGTTALVGESGSGKSTLARALLRLVPHARGEAWFAPEPESVPVDLLSLRGRELRRRRRALQVVFQDPDASLNPRLRVHAALAEPLRVHGLVRGRAVDARVGELLAEVGLEPDAAQRFPHEFSGGQRQRIALARALACEPRLLVLDEALSALDVSVQAQVLNLLAELQARRGLSYLFIAHDLSVVQYIADRVVVLFQGRVVERGRTSEIFDSPAHPYTRGLLEAIPALHPRDRRAVSAGDLRGAGPAPDPAPAGPDPASGCHFRARCPVAVEPCEGSYPALTPLGPTHAAACHLTKE